LQNVLQVNTCFCAKSASKSNPLLFAGLIRKKGQAKRALFWSQGNVTPTAGWVLRWVTRFEARLCLVSNPRQTGKK
jgi:hypothetical protein